jgi:pimeloyl-ACP methyl ester carboxylesterase
MQIVDRGRGVPFVLIPGIQGRWEYLRPTVDALAESFRVITFPLGGERGSGRSFDASRGLDGLSDQVVEVLDNRNVPMAVVCGISFGGLVALRFAARQPERTSALLLTSTPGPDFHLTPRHHLYARVPWLLGPLFLAETPSRLRAELRTAIPDSADLRRFTWRQAKTLVTAPLSLSNMAARARLLGAFDVHDDCGRISAPTLIVTGERHLDRVVRVESTLEYVRAIHGARAVQLDRTGHVGYLTRPQAFVTAVRDFLSSVGSVHHDAA